MQNSTGRIAILGAGNIGSPAAEGILSAKVSEEILITRRSDNFTDEERRKFVCGTDNVRAVKAADIVIIAVQPKQIDGLLLEIKDVLAGQLLISVVSGASIERIESLVGPIPIARAMPNTAIRVRQSMTCLALNGAAEEKRDVVEKIFGAVGKTLHVPESRFAEATVACGSGVALALRFLRADMQGNIAFGFDSGHSLSMSIQVLKGAAMLLEATGNHPEVEIDRVTTPDGCTTDLLAETDHSGLSSAVLRGKRAGREKARRLYATK